MSKKSSGSSLDTVTSLLAERQKYEQWLAALEARRAATPDSVYTRVRADYVGRLERVTEQLKSHADDLAAQSDKLAARLTELGAQEQQRREERAEAELRAHVGELTPEQWEATARTADDEIAAIAAEQAVAAADLSRVHDLLGAAIGPATPVAAPPAPEPQAAPAPPPPAPAQVVHQTPAAPAPQAATPAPQAATPAAPTPARGSGFDELAFLKSVVSPVASTTVPPRAPDAPPGRPSKPAAEVPEPKPDYAADPTKLVSRTNRPSVERQFEREDDSSAAGGLVGKAQPRRSVERPFAANVTGNHPIVLRPSGAIEQPKTLKCGECGAMNYPTEWYCERCGAELASL